MVLRKFFLHFYNRPWFILVFPLAVCLILSSLVILIHYIPEMTQAENEIHKWEDKLKGVDRELKVRDQARFKLHQLMSSEELRTQLKKLNQMEIKRIRQYLKLEQNGNKIVSSTHLQEGEEKLKLKVTDLESFYEHLTELEDDSSVDRIILHTSVPGETELTIVNTSR